MQILTPFSRRKKIKKIKIDKNIPSQLSKDVIAQRRINVHCLLTIFKEVVTNQSHLLYKRIYKIKNKVMTLESKLL